MRIFLLLCAVAALFAACSKAGAVSSTGQAAPAAAVNGSVGQAPGGLNPLLGPLQEASVKGGGTRAFIKISLDDLNDLTLEDYAAFFKGLEGKPYNYVTIFTDEAEGLVYIPAIQTTTNGILDETGAIVEEGAEPFTLVYDDKTGKVVVLAD
jgi:hypothetical protein